MSNASTSPSTVAPVSSVNTCSRAETAAGPLRRTSSLVRSCARPGGRRAARLLQAIAQLQLRQVTREHLGVAEILVAGRCQGCRNRIAGLVDLGTQNQRALASKQASPEH